MYFFTVQDPDETESIAEVTKEDFEIEQSSMYQIFVKKDFLLIKNKVTILIIVITVCLYFCEKRNY